MLLATLGTHARVLAGRRASTSTPRWRLLGLAARFDLVDLPTQFQVFNNPWVIGAAGVLYVVEFFADKIPWVDTMWDTVHTFVRPVGGALVAVATLGEASPRSKGWSRCSAGPWPRAATSPRPAPASPPMPAPSRSGTGRSASRGRLRGRAGPAGAEVPAVALGVSLLILAGDGPGRALDLAAGCAVGSRRPDGVRRPADVNPPASMLSELGLCVPAVASSVGFCCGGRWARAHGAALAPPATHAALAQQPATDHRHHRPRRALPPGSPRRRGAAATFRGGTNLVRLDAYVSANGTPSPISPPTTSRSSRTTRRRRSRASSWSARAGRVAIPRPARVEPNTVAGAARGGADPTRACSCCSWTRWHVQHRRLVPIGGADRSVPRQGGRPGRSGRRDDAGDVGPQNITLAATGNGIDRMLRDNWTWGERGSAQYARPARGRDSSACYPDVGLDRGHRAGDDRSPARAEDAAMRSMA